MKIHKIGSILELISERTVAPVAFSYDPDNAGEPYKVEVGTETEHLGDDPLELLARALRAEADELDEDDEDDAELHQRLTEAADALDGGSED